MSYGLALTLYTISAIIVFVTLVMGIYARNAPRSLYFTYLMLAFFMIAFSYILEVTASSYDAATLAILVQSFGAPYFAPFMLFFVCEYCGLTIKKHQIVLIMFVPVIIGLLMWTFPLNHYYISSIELVSDPFPHIKPTFSSIVYLFSFYSIVIPVVSVSILAYHFRRRDKIFRRQASAIMAALVMPYAGAGFNALVGRNMIGFDSTPVFLSLSCVLIGYSMLQLGLYRIVPIAREHIMETMSDGYILLDMQGGFVDANSEAKRLIPQITAISVGSKMEGIEGLSGLGDGAGLGKKEFSVTKTAEITRHYRISETAINHMGKPFCRCLMIYDITETRQLLDEVSHMAERDALTGLINRRAFYNKGNTLFENECSHGRCDAAMFMIDLDFFKNINDTYGHIMGDEVLVAIAGLLSARFRVTDLVARYGGEEFCAFLPYTSEKCALGVAQELRRNIELLEFSAKGNLFHVTTSIGLAVYDPDRHHRIEMLLADADAALYAAKNGGRNAVFVARTVQGGGNRSMERQIVFERSVQGSNPILLQ